MNKKYVENWTISTKFLFHASHQNYIGSKVDEELHSHTWSVEIVGQHNKLNNDGVLFSFKTIAEFVFDLLNDRNLNDLLENRGKYIDEKYLPYITEIINEPTNEVIQKLVGRLIIAKISMEDPEMSDILINVIFKKVDGIKTNLDIDEQDLNLNCETTCQYTCKQI